MPPFESLDLGLLALRLAIGAIFLAHGLPKRHVWKKAPPQTSAKMVAVMKILSIAEPLGAVAVLAGFLTQLASVGLAIIMAGAIKMKITVWKMPFKADDKTGWELDLLLLCACLVLLTHGAGILSADFLLYGRWR